MSGELRVVYEGFNEQLDEALEEVVAGFGYHRWASGFSHEDGKRDLAFDKIPSLRPKRTEAQVDALIEMVRRS